MARQRIDMHRLQELVRLHRLGRTGRDIARMLGMGRNTLRGYCGALERAGLLEGPAGELPDLGRLQAAVQEHLPPPAPRPPPRSTVEPWREAIDGLRQRGAGPTAIHDWLRLHEPGYAGTVSAVRRLCRRLSSQDGPDPTEVAIRVETDPGEVAQVDFANAGLRYDPATKVLRRSFLFVMTLGFSRHMFTDLVFDQKIETWIRLHVAAFEFLGGVPRVLVPDNLKAAVVRAAFGVSQDAQLNRSYRELARHYGFQIDPTPPRAPQKKGKVERSVSYVRSSFLATHESIDMETDRRELRRWLLQVAGMRRHGTTGRRPLELFEEQERQALLPLPATRFEMVVWKQAKVHRDTHVQVEGAFYSVPWRYMGQAVWVRAQRERITILAGDEVVATHPRLGRGQRGTVDAHLPDHRGDLRHRARAHWIGRATVLGEDVALLAQEIFEQDDVLSQLRKVQAVVRLLEGYPRERAVRAARRARRFGCLDYRGIKRILTQALDLVALPDEQQEIPWIRDARFARRPTVTYVPPKEPLHGTQG
jgi:transposase